MDYKHIIDEWNENRYLISMTPIAQIVRLGMDSGMNGNSTVLDLCCGYGKMLSVWHETCGIHGIGVDICGEFIRKGRQLLMEKRITAVDLIEADIFQWKTDRKFDYVSLSGEDFGGISGTIDLLAKYVQPDGKLIIGTRFSKVENPPKELIDFEGETLSLRQINQIVREKGYYITTMETDTNAEWERYITWSARRNLAALRKNPTDEQLRMWTEKWYDTYFSFRREYEGYITFVIEKE